MNTNIIGDNANMFDSTRGGEEEADAKEKVIAAAHLTALRNSVAFPMIARESKVSTRVTRGTYPSVVSHRKNDRG